MFKKDQRIEVVNHPWLNKTCIAKRNIRRNEKFHYWGRDVGLVVDTDNDYILTVCDNSSSVDPTFFVDSYLQFANAPGPDEKDNITPTRRYMKKNGLISQEFRAVCNIPKGHQILWSYGDEPEWFDERNINKINCGTQKLPSRSKYQ